MNKTNLKRILITILTSLSLTYSLTLLSGCHAGISEYLSPSPTVFAGIARKTLYWWIFVSIDILPSSCCAWWPKPKHSNLFYVNALSLLSLFSHLSHTHTHTTRRGWQHCKGCGRNFGRRMKITCVNLITLNCWVRVGGVLLKNKRKEWLICMYIQSDYHQCHCQAFMIR